MPPLALGCSSGMRASGASSRPACVAHRPLGLQGRLQHAPHSQQVALQRQQQRQRRLGPLAASGAGGAGGSGGTEREASRPQYLDPQRWKEQLRMLSTLIVRFPALVGSVAVGAGWFLHIDALPMHWNTHDALLGLQCATPLLVLDAVLLLPDYSPGTTSKVIKMQVPRAVAEKMKELEAAKEAGKAKRAAGDLAGAEVDAAAVGQAGRAALEAARSRIAAEAAAAKQQEQQQQADKAPPAEDLTDVLRGISSAASATVVDALDAAEAAAPAANAKDAAAAGAAAGADEPAAAASSSSAAVAATAAVDAPAAGEAAAPAAADAPAAAAASEAAGKEEDTGGELVEVERTISVRAEQPPIVAALYRVQMEKVVDNVGRALWWPFEMVLLATWHLAEEMLYRAVILTWAAGWTIDRLYEAGADETVDLLGFQLATPQAGATFAAIGVATVSLAVLVQRALFPAKLIAKAEAELEAAEVREAAKEERAARARALAPPPAGMAGSSRVPDAKERVRMRKVLQKVKGGLVRQRQWSTAIEGARDVTEWAAYSTSFLLTGNLLAPYVTACAADVLFTGYQRFKGGAVDAAQQRSLQQIQELAGAARAVQAARKKVLQEGASASAGKEEGKKEEEQSSGGGGSNGSESSSNGNGVSNGSLSSGEEAPGVQQQTESSISSSDKEEEAPAVGAGSSKERDE